MGAYGQGVYGQGVYGKGVTALPLAPYASAVLADSPWGAWPVNQPTYSPLLINTGTEAAKFLPGVGSVAEAALDGGAGGRSTGGIAPVATNVSTLAVPGAQQSMTFLVKVISNSMMGTFGRIGAASDGWGVGVGGTTVDNSGRQLVLLSEAIAWLPTGWSFPAGAGTYRVHVTRDGTTFTAYVNGTQVFSGTSGINAPSAALAIGSGVMSSPNPRVLTAGVVLDDFAYFTTALTAARVAAQYATPTEIDVDAPAVHLPLGPTDNIADATSAHRDLFQQSGPTPTLATSGAPGALPFLDFNATDFGYLRTAGLTAQPTTVTYEAWVRLNALPSATVTVQAFGGADLTGVTSAMQIDSLGRVQFALYNGGNAGIVASSPLSLGGWHHIVCSVGAAGAKIRVDKITVASSATTSVLSITSGAYYLRHGGPNTTEVAADIDIASPATWQSQLTNAQTDAHYAAAFPYEAAVLADSPILYAPLGESAAPALDHSASPKTVDCQGGYTYGVPGRTSGVLAGGLNGAAIVTTANPGTFNDLTIEMWVKTTTTGGATLASCRTSGAYSLTLYMGLNPVGGISPGQLVFGISGDGTWTGVRTTSVVNDGAWHHIAAVWDGTPGTPFDIAQCRIYIDGLPVTLSAVPYSNPAIPITAGRGYYFGGHGSESGGDVTGSMSDLAIYPAPLPKERVQAHYVAGGGTLVDPDARGPLASAITALGPLAYWRLHDAADSTANARDGAFAGSVAQTASLTVSEPGNKSTSFAGGRLVVPFGAWMHATAAAFTWFGLVNNVSQTGSPQLINHDVGGGGGELSWRIYLAGGKLSAVSQRNSDGAYVTLTCATTLNNATTYALAVTFDGTTMRGYVNGVLDGSVVFGGPLRQTNSPISIGGLTGNSAALDGKGDEFALFSSALTGAQVTDLYTASLTPPAASNGTVIACGIPRETDSAPAATILVALRISLGVATETDVAPSVVFIPKPPTPTDAYSAVVLADSPVLFWKLGETGGVALDYSGANRAGVLSGAYARGAGAVTQNSEGASTEFIAGVATRADDAAMHPDTLTVETWFTPTTLPSSGEIQVVAARGMTNRFFSADSWGIYLVGSTLRYMVSSQNAGGSGIVIDRTLGTMVAGSRYHLIFSIEGSGSNPDPATFTNVRVMLNGVAPSGAGSQGNGQLIAQPAIGTPLTVGAGPYRVDAGDSGSTKYFTGRIDEFAMYSTALSSARMLAHYNAGLPAAGVVILGRGVETDTAPPATVKAAVLLQLGVATETDTAPPATTGAGQRIPLGVATEADTARPAATSTSAVIILRVATETDSAGPLTMRAARILALGVATETDAARALTLITAKRLQLQVAVETDIASMLTIYTTGAPPAPSDRIYRWSFTDPATGASYLMPISPDSMAPLGRPRRTTRHGNGMRRDRRVRTFVGAPKAMEWSFGGAIRTKEHYDALAAWARVPREVVIHDHLGRDIRVLFTSFEPVDRRPNSHTPWRLRYTMKCYILEAP